MDTYKLTETERKLLTRIDSPHELNGKRCTRPVVIAFDKLTGLLVGLNSLEMWRLKLNSLPNYRNNFRFELHNMW